MPRKKHFPPRPHAHRASGQDRVLVDGKHIYLGPIGSEQSRLTYEALVERLTANRPVPPESPAGQPIPSTGLTVAELIERYDAFAEGYYRKRGVPTRQLQRVRRALGFVLDEYAGLPAARFGPLALEKVREKMIECGWKRGTVNAHVGCVTRAWGWAASREMVPAACWQALQALPGLKAGRSAAKESHPVGPPDPAAVLAATEFMPRVVADMVRVQRLTGMRGGEVCSMRADLIDRTSDVWVYTPGDHKTAHLGHGRTVPLGPRAVAVITPRLLLGDPYVFSPLSAERDRLAAIAAKARPKKGKAGRKKATSRRRPPGECYTSNSYAQAIRRACVAAGVEPWHSHQLRHERATELRRLFGAELARAALGHSGLDATAIYAEADLDAVKDAARKAG